MSQVTCGAFEPLKLVEHGENEENVMTKCLHINAFERDWVEQPCKVILDQLDHQVITGDIFLFASLLRRCGEARALAEGKKVHGHIMNSRYANDRFLGNLLVQMYGNCGAIGNACAVFTNLNERNEFSWAIMIRSSIQNGRCKEAFQFFRKMEIEGMKPDKVILVHIFSACATWVAIAEGKRLHASIAGSALESDVFVSNAIVNMYAKCGCLDLAFMIFKKMPERDIVCWNTLLAAYAESGETMKFLHFFRQMLLEDVMPNKVTYVSALDALGDQTFLAEIKKMHVCLIASGIEPDVVVGTALVNIYGKCGRLEDAWRVFNEVVERNVVSWSAMIAAYAHLGHNEKAFQLLQQMQWEGVVPNNVTYLSILDACANLGTLAKGKRTHTHLTNGGIELDADVAATLINMYAKCGSLNDARTTFDNISQRDVVVWSSMIVALAQHGQGNEALECFQLMLLQGITPTRVTFFGIFSACGHVGFVDECWHYLVSMTLDYHITPTVEHYNCVVDLLGRVGQLDEAENMLKNMPTRPTAMSWVTLLAACKMHLDVERGKRAAGNVSALDLGDATPYVLLSNISALVGKWQRD